MRPRPVEPHPLLGPLSDAQELALAVVLWKSLRCHGALLPHTAHPSYESVILGERAIAMAKRAGVAKEFFDLLFRLKLVQVVLVPME